MNRTTSVIQRISPAPPTAIPSRYPAHRRRVLAILARWERSYRRQCGY